MWFSIWCVGTIKCPCSSCSVFQLELSIVNDNLIFHFYQIKREISTMKLIKHPNVVQLHEVLCYLCRNNSVITTHTLLFFFFISSHSMRILHSMCVWQVMASKSKIYMVLEYVDGGELFDKIVRPMNFLCQISRFLFLFMYKLLLHAVRVACWTGTFDCFDTDWLIRSSWTIQVDPFIIMLLSTRSILGD